MKNEELFYVEYEVVGDLKVAKLMDIINHKLNLIDKYINRDVRAITEKEMKKLGRLLHIM